MRGIVLALRAKISACVITRSREECKEHGDDHYDLGTGGNSIFIRKVDYTVFHFPSYTSRTCEGLLR